MVFSILKVTDKKHKTHENLRSTKVFFTVGIQYDAQSLTYSEWVLYPNKKNPVWDQNRNI